MTRVMFPYTKPIPGGYRHCVYELDIDVVDGQWVATPIKPRYWQVIPRHMRTNVYIKSKSGKPFYYMGIKPMF